MNTPHKKRSYEKVSDTIVEYSIKPTIVYPSKSNPDRIATGRYDLMSTVFINLNSEKTIKSKNTLISMLSTLLSNDIKPSEKKRLLQKDYGISMSHELESEVSSMCNLNEAIEEKAIEQGLEQGKSVTIYDLVQTEVIPPAVGAEKLGITVEQLRKDMEAAGFHINE